MPFDLAALANRDLLEQAIGNLVENAAKYTVEGEIVLCAEPAGRQVRLVVSDTGPGADLPSDGGFQRFYRDPAAQGEGFGLGVAIAAEAVRALGGELEIGSGDQGTRVVATLPAAVVQAVVTERILVVDDEPAIVDAVAYALEGEGTRSTAGRTARPLWRRPSTTGSTSSCST